MSADSPDHSSLSYRDAGVDIDAGNELVQRIKPIAQRTARPGVLSGLGGFGALFELPLERYSQPLLVAATDGVGTKLKLATEWDHHDDIGIDLVAMCVNDIVVQGAEPLFFLDYYATGQLTPSLAERIIAGIGRGCELAGAALIGGESAEMPGVYAPGDYDLAGFCVGIVNRDRLIDGSQVRPGDRLLGLASSGPHANGYSLIRKILQNHADPSQVQIDGQALSSVLLAPTRIYVRALLALHQQVPLHALAHITGGGILENLPRVLPHGVNAIIHREAWQVPAIFTWLRSQGGMSEEEMLRTFNNGIGMILCLPEKSVAQATTILEAQGETVFSLGLIEDAAPQASPTVVLR